MKSIRYFIILSIVLVLASCSSFQKPTDIFQEHKENFKRAVSIRDSLTRNVPTCYSFRITSTGKAFWQECDSVKPNPHLGETFLYRDDADFLKAFMSDCNIRYMLFRPTYVEFVFEDRNLGRIVRTDTSFNDFKANQIDSLFYLISKDDPRPE